MFFVMPAIYRMQNKIILQDMNARQNFNPTITLSRDYSLVGQTGKEAEERGLVGAQWHSSPLPRKRIKELMKRKDGPAIFDTLLWFALLIISGTGGYLTWGSWWAVPFFAIYGVLYCSVSDSRWHECGHGTAFKTDWMNHVIFQMATFMVMREPTPSRWSHMRHHSDTIIVGRDPEIGVPRPPDFFGLILSIFNLNAGPAELRKVLLHCFGKRLTKAEMTYIPEAERKTVYFASRIHVLIYAIVMSVSLWKGTILPLMYIGLPSFYGAWLMLITSLTQHAGLAEDVLDHRLNCRTVYMNPILRFLYWNMNYHLEHHMFPMVPYHALPALHEEVKADTPKPYHGLFETYCEIIPALLKQRKNPSHYVKRELPNATQPIQPIIHKADKIEMAAAIN